jgi:hypothetical protein
MLTDRIGGEDLNHRLRLRLRHTSPKNYREEGPRWEFVGQAKRALNSRV